MSRDRSQDWVRYSIPLDDGGHVRVMAQAEGYLMVRRPHGVPFIMSVKEAERLTAASNQVEEAA